MRLTKREAYKALGDSVEYQLTHPDRSTVESICRELQTVKTRNWIVGELQNIANPNRDIYPFGPNDKRNAQLIWMFSRRMIVRSPKPNKFFEITEKGKQILEWCIMHDIMPFWEVV